MGYMVNMAKAATPGSRSKPICMRFRFDLNSICLVLPHGVQKAKGRAVSQHARKKRGNRGMPGRRHAPQIWLNNVYCSAILLLSEQLIYLGGKLIKGSLNVSAVNDDIGYGCGQFPVDL